ncbi:MULTISPECIES: SMI1/KNR4 family protein [unclassified Streptomyces]|uniref:SMI1/KNR4 family protein n=1 Tax=unclassified Streptomyces TaxID=2593676 RepID=UPI00225B2686|nr:MULTISPECIES: SMI1/KNR4 family protein [unclassified Streptomyces]MCX5141951.1 SMI1/KNR4 family protein [Streptomyces sp. NBC_00338]WSU60418.1 SMI1/KNR4 family protein [Streptomyces sp. NBC_01104]
MPDQQNVEDEAAQVRAAWTWLTDWLGENAPGSAASLRPGASDDRVAQAEQRLGFTLPASLRALWTLNDGVVHSRTGASAFLDGHGPLPIETALDTHGALSDAWPDWDPLWLPFTANEVDEPWSGDFIHCGTGATGFWGMEDMEDEPGMHGDGSGGALTLPGMLAQIVEALREGTGPRIGSTSAPGIVDGGLVWMDPRDVWMPGWTPLHP